MGTSTAEGQQPTFSTTATQAIKSHAKRQLLSILDTVRGRKGLVLDPSLSGPISLLVDFATLKEHGVEKIYHLQGDKMDIEYKNLIYILHPSSRDDLSLVRTLIAHIQYHHRIGATGMEYWVYFVPTRDFLSQSILEESGVLGDISEVGEFHLDWIPLEEGLFSLELESTFRDLYLLSNAKCLTPLAYGIRKLECIFGRPATIIGKGSYAKKLKDLLIQMHGEEDVESRPKSNTGFADIQLDTLCILDREVDFYSLMCTQLTYEGLIDEYCVIKSTFVEVDSSSLYPLTKFAPTSSIFIQTATHRAPSSLTVESSFSELNIASSNARSTRNSKKIALSSTDPLFRDLRDLNFAIVGSTLSTIAKRLQANYERRHEAKTVSEIRDFVGQLGALQSEQGALSTHTKIAEQLTKISMSRDFHRNLEVQQNAVAGMADTSHIEYIQELIDRGYPFYPMIRLLCLYSLVCGGIKTKSYDLFRREIVQTYGYKYIIILAHLRTVGLLKVSDAPSSSSARSTKNVYSALRKQLDLIVDDVDEHHPTDFSHVFSGYAPVSIRFVQRWTITNGKDSSQPPASKASASTASNLLSSGKANTPRQNGGSSSAWKGLDETVKGDDAFEVVTETRRSSSSVKRIVVVFIGGVTYAEVSAIRFLNHHFKDRVEYVVMTTNMINGNTAIASLEA